MFVHLESVSFRYNRRAPWVLREVTLSLPPGRITEVTGRNGAGKSTLLRLIAGMLPPRQGTITGRPGNVGYAPERFPTDQPFTVRAYLTHMAAMRRLPRTAITPWSERLAFTHLMDTRLPDLSKGTAQKVGLAQALLASPELLVLDEPFAGLDTTTRADLRTLLTELTTQGTTIIASDHQSCLTQLPNLRQVHIANTAVTQAQSQPPALDDTSHPNQLPQDEWTVVEVLVRPAEREAVTAKLRADGYNLRTPTN